MNSVASLLAFPLLHITYTVVFSLVSFFMCSGSSISFLSGMFNEPGRDTMSYWILPLTSTKAISYPAASYFILSYSF